MPDERFEELLTRIRAGLGGRTGETPIPPALDGHLLRTEADADWVEMFATRLRATGAELQRTTLDELPEVLDEHLQGMQQASLGFSDPDLQELVRDALARCAVRESEAGDAHFESQIGITDVDLAVAETGTLGYSSSAERPRRPAFIAPQHLVLVRTEQIVPDLVDYLDHRPLSGPSSELLITGPSKTADIEGILIQGVHGPGSVKVLLIA